MNVQRQSVSAGDETLSFDGFGGEKCIQDKSQCKTGVAKEQYAFGELKKVDPQNKHWHHLLSCHESCRK